MSAIVFSFYFNSGYGCRYEHADDYRCYCDSSDCYRGLATKVSVY